MVKCVGDDDDDHDGKKEKLHVCFLVECTVKNNKTFNPNDDDDDSHQREKNREELTVCRKL